MLNIRIVNAPHLDVLQMLQRRMPPHGRAYIRDNPIGAVGLIQSHVTDLFFFSDIALKAADVFTVEIYGTCPQHVTSLAVMGEVSAVRTAMDAIEAQQSPF
ncbi:BMC domain-containing protein [Rhodobium gokarnense]|uniref:Bacterial microcompartment domain-containing protein n=1 Tax=Rhodobium gokarnense TaxID=364296 RepID=A0ABT3HB69_9HYPH|nr:BMC domain-containing protein [Rhodobium gokarnense]MCW2307647.1 hypothetical protein [Rhodobium gokarnense]